jgi:glycosyltransferase involved in cell wall biosynthesis
MLFSKIDISVIICCYNSENRIVHTLEHLACQNIGSLNCEIILVDNNCTDRTVELAINKWNSLGNPFELIVLEEKMAGLSFARKSGVIEAKGEIIVFCDDDNWLKDDYLTNGYSIITKNTSIGVLGGQGLAEFEGSPPDWFETHQDSYAVGRQHFFSGDISERGYVWGAGCIVRNETMRKFYEVGFENLCLDRCGEKLTSGGDSEISKWHLLIGQKLWYDDRLLYIHFIENKRMNMSYLEGLQSGFLNSSNYLSLYDEVIYLQQLESSQIIKFTLRKLIKTMVYFSKKEFAHLMTMRKIWINLKKYNSQ